MSISGNIRAGAAYVEVTAQTSKLQRGLASAQAQLQQFGRSCASIGKDMLMLTGAFAAPLAMAVKGFAAFDDQMRLAKAVTKATRAEFESMTQVAAKLGRETSFTAKQVADGMVALGRMGFSPKEVEQAIAPTLDLARATGTELGEAADIAANSMRIFGIEAERMSDVADVLTATANGSAQTLTDLFEALKMAGPQAKAAGENITDTSAAIGILANVGVKGSLAGTALRKSYSQFAKTKVQDKLKGIGIATVDSSGNLRKMADIMADIGMAMSSMPSAEKISFAEEIFDIRGSLAGLSLGDNVKGLQAFIEKLQNIRGTAGNTAKEMDDGLGGSFRMLLSAVEGAMNAIAKALEGTLKPFVDRATEATLAIIKWIEANSGLVTGFALAVAGAAALGAALIVIGTASKGAAAGIAVAGSAVKGFTFLQGLCIAQGAALKNSLSLIAAAFVNFRNTAIPAMVGTEQLCAALGLASSASNRAAASIVLMSNAEAAAAAKSFLAARWTAMAEALKHFRNSAVMATVATRAQGAAELAMSAKNAIISGWIGMTKALKGLSAATAAATAVTYAHTAAEAVCTAGTVALNKARRLAAATTALFTAANLKAAVSISAVAAGNFLLATAAKVAAIAMMGLTAVMSAIAAHPVAAALIALGVILAGVVICLYRAANYTAKLSDQMSKLREKNDEVRKSDQLRMERLKQLSEKQHLTNAEMKEARRLAGELKSRYGDLGISISDNTMRITAMNSAVSRLGDVQLRVDNKDDLDKLQRLKALTLKVNLSVPEQKEASALVEELSNKYGSLGLEADRTKKRVVLLSDAVQRLQGVRMTAKIEEPDFSKFEQLKNLTMETGLSVRQQEDAETLIRELSTRYGDLGLAVDKTAGKIRTLNTVAGSIADVSFKVHGAEDIQKLQRLKELSLETRLTAGGQDEASRIIDELRGKYGELGVAVDKASARIAAMNAESARLQAIEPEVREPEDLVKLQRLKALSLELRLDVQQQTEAETLIAGLSAKYGELGVAVDKASGKIVKLNSVAAGLREIGVKVSGTEDADKAARLRQLAELPGLDASGIAEANSLLEQLKARYGDVGLAVGAATGRIIALTEAQKRFAEAQNIIQAGNDPLKETHLAQLERLKKLAVQEKLTVAEQTEAQRIVSALNGAYNGLGLGIDAVAGKLAVAASAQKKLNDTMKQATLSELDAEIAEMETNIRELQKENDALMSYGNHNLWSQISGRQEETVGRIETNGERMASYRQKINAVKRRRKAVEQEKAGAMTGSDGKTEPSTAEKIETEKQRRRQSQDAADEAAKRVAEIDKKLARERKTELENEIDDIVALRDEYKALIQTMLDYEKSKPEDGRDNEKISELEGKLAQADKTAQERIVKAQEKAAEKMRKDAADFQKSFNDAQKDVQLRRAEDAQDRNIEKTMETDKSAGIRMIQELIRQYQLAAATAKRQFEQELLTAQADGKIDGGERDRISEVQAAYTRAESLVDKYSGKLREAQSGTRSAAEESSRVNGSFLAAALNAALGGGGNEAERTANATEMMAKNSRETNRLLKRMGKNGNTALTYA